MIRFSPVGRGTLGLSLLLGCATAFADDAAPAINSGDTAFVALCSLVVLLMTLPGLALFYGGMARTKNVLSILMQVFCSASLASLLFAIYGYSLTFADGGSLQAIIGGVDKLFLAGITTDSVVGSIPEYLYFLFMLLFAAITPAIIVGGFAERMKFSAVMVFMAAWLTLNYIPMAHMAWGGGWVFDLGVQDFAGGNVVHLNVGIAALVGAWLVGRRRGFGTPTLAPHNMTMTLTTMLASCAGALGWIFVEWQHRGRPSLFGAVSGAIAGLVAITPACGFVGPMGAILLGLIAGPVCVWSVDKLKPMIGLDDAFDVFGVHGVAGILGGLLTPVFALTALGGQGFAEGRTLMDQLLINGGAILFSVLFSALTSWIAYKVAAALCGGLRVDEESEVDGLDLSAHGEVGYKYSS
jgi:Amt family ammonium transporter